MKSQHLSLMVDGKQIEDERCELLPYDPSTTVEKLLHKISQLEVQLQEPSGVSRSDHHRNRILGKVVEHELRQFLKEAYQKTLCQRCLSELSPRALPKGRTSETYLEEESMGESENREDPDLQRALSRSLDVLRVEKKELEERIRALQENTIEPLQREVEALQNDKLHLQLSFAKLQEEHTTLLEEMRESFCSNKSNPVDGYSSPMEELHQLRKTEALLCSQLHEMKHSALMTTDNMVEVMKASEKTALTRISALEDSLVSHKEKLREVELGRNIAILLLDEERERHRREVDILGAQRQQWGAYYLHALQMWEDRYSEAKICVLEEENKSKQLEEKLKNIQKSIQTDEDAGKMPQGKRRRVELHEYENDEEAVNKSKPLRLKYLSFWESGHLKIAEQESHIKTLEERCSTLRVSEKKLRQLQQQQQFGAQQVVMLASTVEQLRKEERDLKAELAGVRVERDCLIDTMGNAFARDNAEIMSREELEKCAGEVRQAARVAAAASAAVVADPKVIEEAARRAHACKTEVERLEKQKEKLLRFIQLRQGRIASLLSKEAVSLLGFSLSSSGETPRKPDTLISSNVHLAQILEHAKECARDIFMDCETSIFQADPTATQNHTNNSSSSLFSLPHSLASPSHLSQRQQLDALLQERISMQKTCESLQEECSHLIAALHQKKSELAEHILTSERVINALQTTNRELITHLSDLRTQMSSLNQRNLDMKDLVCASMRGMRCMFDLLKAEVSSSAQLRQMITAERNHLRSVLLRFEHGESSEERRASSQIFQQQKMEVVSAISSLGAQIEDTAHLFHLDCSADRTSFLLELVKALRTQEDRLSQLQKKYEENVEQLARRLTEHVDAAHRKWDTLWQEKYESVEAFQRHILAKEKSCTTVLQKLEEVSCTMPTPQIEPPVSTSGMLTHEAVDEAIRAIQLYMKHPMLEEGKETVQFSAPMSDSGTVASLTLTESDNNLSADTVTPSAESFKNVG